jgi:hypothetical protein
MQCDWRISIIELCVEKTPIERDLRMTIQFQGQLHFVAKADNPREANTPFSRASGLISGVRKYQRQAHQDGFHYAISILSDKGGTALISPASLYVKPNDPSTVKLIKGDNLIRKLFETNKAFVKRAMLTARAMMTEPNPKASETLPISAK